MCVSVMSLCVSGLHHQDLAYHSVVTNEARGCLVPSIYDVMDTLNFKEYVCCGSASVNQDGLCLHFLSKNNVLINWITVRNNRFDNKSSK